MPPVTIEADAAARARCVERGHALEAVGSFLEPGVHRAHQHAVGQRDEAEVERREQVGIARHGGIVK